MGYKVKGFGTTQRPAISEKAINHE